MSQDMIDDIRFDGYHLEIWSNPPAGTKRVRLSRNETDLDIPERSLDVMEQLFSKPRGQVIERNDIFRRVWGNHREGVNPNNIDTHIRVLRRALGDDARKPEFIQAASRHGYRFLREFTRTQRPAPVEATGTLDSPEDLRRAFAEFFGVSGEEQGGVIILQSDHLDDALKDKDRRQPFAQASSRFYKARTCVNKWDTYGAAAIQNAFQRQGMRVPSLVLSDHHGRETGHLADPFRISMGLGFTDETTKTIQNQICGRWMRISKSSGDAVSFHKGLLPSRKEARVKWDSDPGHEGFRRLLPCDWDDGYVNKWLRMLPPHNEEEVRDYAMIFRHTRREPHHQVLFVVAGFTERGTGIAGQYLADQWKKLWETHVQGQTHHGSLGDFLVIIEGPSDITSIDDWSEDKTLRVTPLMLSEKGIRCEWADRLEED